jgi:hypothetical protein|tara:strand:+ start:123 stop:281 length:159 start_codon:yes stop_codon:yes gene_type:complete
MVGKGQAVTGAVAKGVLWVATHLARALPKPCCQSLSGDTSKLGALNSPPSGV